MHLQAKRENYLKSELSQKIQAMLLLFLVSGVSVESTKGARTLWLSFKSGFTIHMLCIAWPTLSLSEPRLSFIIGVLVPQRIILKIK